MLVLRSINLSQGTLSTYLLPFAMKLRKRLGQDMMQAVRSRSQIYAKAHRALLQSHALITRKHFPCYTLRKAEDHQGWFLEFINLSQGILSTYLLPFAMKLRKRLGQDMMQAVRSRSQIYAKTHRALPSTVDLCHCL